MRGRRKSLGEKPELCLASEEAVRAFSFEQKVKFTEISQEDWQDSKGRSGPWDANITHEIMVQLTLGLKAGVGTIMMSPTCRGYVHLR